MFEPVEINIIMLGSSGVGKSSLMTRYIDNKFVSELSTIGVSIRHKDLIVGDKQVKVIINDTSGQERYQAIARQYYRNANIVIMVYDITDEASFSKVIDYWSKDVAAYIPDATVFLVGNKFDHHVTRQVLYSTAYEFSKQNFNTEYFEVSAKNGINISPMFSSIINYAVLNKCYKNKIEPNQSDKITVLPTINPSTTKYRNSCC